MTRAPLILVVGMHRSGTSLLGSILQALGVALPGPLIPGDQHNPTGYFERSDITALQEELLIDLQRWWPSEQGALDLPQEWLKSARAQRVAHQLKLLLKAEQAQHTGPWAIKDPRSSLLLPLWRQVAAELNQPLRLLLAFRDPAEVVTSLITRDAEATGMTTTRAQTLWIRHQQQLLLDAGDLPLQVVSYSRWFNAPRAQIEALQRFCQATQSDSNARSAALGCIRPDYRRSHSSSQAPPLNRQTQRWHQQLERAAEGSPQPLLHWAAKQRKPAQPSPWRQSPTALQHPWIRALKALGLNASDPQSKGLLAWQQQGIPPHSLAQLSALNQPGFPGEDPSSDSGSPLPAKLKLGLVGGSLQQWDTHIWIHRLPLTSSCTLEGCQPNFTTQAVLHLQALKRTAQDPNLLLHLTQVDRVFDPDPNQVRLLRLLGVNAEQLGSKRPQASADRGNWFNAASISREAGIALGLPNPQALVLQGHTVLCLGCNGNSNGWQTLPNELLHLPSFPPAPALSEQQAHLLGGWIQASCDAGLTLVRLNPKESEQLLWNSLGVPTFRYPIGPEELLEELAWQRAGRPEPAAIHTPWPGTDLVWEHARSVPADVAICISSYNYADRITAALESCRAQSLQALELVIVDDASTDDSLERCRTWLANHGQRFCRVKLLRHQTNSGLAAARNTAFAAATAAWCWVLDADNTIDQQACERSLSLAQASPQNTAVIHPLIRIDDDRGAINGWVGGGHAWQREQLQAGNVVDAMALVRRSAWEAVGGYSHIPGGWEDFDFWCKLIDADWHGVIYPKPLATYTQHGTSMLQSQTNHRQRRLSRLLLKRHPWLQLAFAAENT
jgi:GT2 family glycosyltransferase